MGRPYSGLGRSVRRPNVLGQPSHVGHRSHARLGWPSEIWDILPQGGMIRTWDDPVESKVGQPYQTPRETGAHEVTQPLTGTPVGRLTPAAAASPCRSRVAARGGRARRGGVWVFSGSLNKLGLRVWRCAMQM